MIEELKLENTEVMMMSCIMNCFSADYYRFANFLCGTSCAFKWHTAILYYACAINVCVCAHGEWTACSD